jgi:hypothetical protein
MRTLFAVLVALSLATGARAQTFTVAQAQQVANLAPQLVAFSGSTGNFESLINGLTAGTPVTLTTLGADGVMQIVTFVPAGTLSAADAARFLETTRQNLIAQGTATPSAQQLALALLGSNTSTLQVRSEVTSAASAGTSGPLNLSAANLQALRTALAQGTAVTLTSTTPGGVTQTVSFTSPGGPMSDFDANQALQLASTLLAQQGIFNPTLEQLRAALVGGTLTTAAGTGVPLQGVLQGRVRNTSDSALLGTSNSRSIGTSNTPPTPTSALTPAPASGAGVVRPSGVAPVPIRPGARPGG